MEINFEKINIKLLSFENENYEYIENYYLNEKIRTFMTFEKNFLGNTLSKYIVEKNFDLLFLVYNKTSGETMGIIYIEELSVGSENVFFKIFIEKEKMQIINIVKLYKLFSDFIKKYYNVRNSYTFIFSDEIEELEHIKKVESIKVGSLEKHKYYNGMYRTMFIYKVM